MTFYVENEVLVEFGFDVREICEDILRTILVMEECPYETQVNLLITDNEGIHLFNREYRNIDKSTDVLSFPMITFNKEADFSIVEANQADYFDPDSGELILGDVIVSAQKVIEQAQYYGHSQKREFAFLIAHSILHLCGYDHMDKEEAKRMEYKQNQVMSLLNITRDN